jgi:hypothetical protein
LANGITSSGEAHDEITHFMEADDVELRPKTYLAVYVCSKSWGGTTTNKDGDIVYDGSPVTDRRTVWFTKDPATMDIKISLYADEREATCEA